MPGKGRSTRRTSARSSGVQEFGSSGGEVPYAGPRVAFLIFHLVVKKKLFWLAILPDKQR
jgi:hypothetical protein